MVTFNAQVYLFRAIIGFTLILINTYDDLGYHYELKAILVVL